MGVEGGVCANHLHFCILIFLDLVSRLQLVVLSITIKIHHLIPNSISCWRGSVVIFR